MTFEALYQTVTQVIGVTYLVTMNRFLYYSDIEPTSCLFDNTFFILRR